MWLYVVYNFIFFWRLCLVLYIECNFDELLLWQQQRDIVQVSRPGASLFVFHDLLGAGRERLKTDDFHDYLGHGTPITSHGLAKWTCSYPLLACIAISALHRQWVIVRWWRSCKAVTWR